MASTLSWDSLRPLVLKLLTLDTDNRNLMSPSEVDGRAVGLMCLTSDVDINVRCFACALCFQLRLPQLLHCCSFASSSPVGAFVSFELELILGLGPVFPAGSIRQLAQSAVHEACWLGIKGVVGLRHKNFGLGQSVILSASALFLNVKIPFFCILV